MGDHSPDFDRWAFTDLHSLREQYLDGKPEPVGLLDWLESQLGFAKWIAQRTMQASPRWQNFDMDGELRDSANAGTVGMFAHPQDRAHVALNDPAQAIAEVEIKQQLIDLLFRHAATVDSEWGCGHTADEIRAGQCEDTPVAAIAGLRLLALPYADRPGYDERWRP